MALPNPSPDVIVSIVLDVLSLVLALLMVEKLKKLILVFIFIIIGIYMMAILYERFGKFIERRSLIVMGIFIAIIIALVPIDKYIEANANSFEYIKSAKYEEELFGNQGLTETEALFPSDDFFRSMYENSDYIELYLDKIPLKLPFNLSIETKGDISFGKYMELFARLKDNTEYLYLFKYADRYHAIRAENENQKISFSTTGRCYVYLKYDFKAFLREWIRRGEEIPKIDYKDSLIVIAFKNKKFYETFKTQDFNGYLESRKIRNLYDLNALIKSFKLSILITQS